MIKHHGKSNVLGSVDWGLSPRYDSMLPCASTLTASGLANHGGIGGVDSLTQVLQQSRMRSGELTILIVPE